jgi:hypothetical protein
VPMRHKIQVLFARKRYIRDLENSIQLIQCMQFEQHDVEIYKMESRFELEDLNSFVSFLRSNVVLNKHINKNFEEMFTHFSYLLSVHAVIFFQY